jgi:serine/threonine-protein kinase
VGPYEVLEKLGTGGMGEVFLCHDSRLHRKVALKCLTSDEPAEAHANVLREARAAARLTHPHIASVYDVLLQDGRAFIVMEYVEGELRSRLSAASLRPTRPSPSGGACAALSAAHAQGVIHRDLKPSNVQLMPDGTVKVLDFGVAKMMPRLDVTNEPTTTNLPSQSRSDTPGTPAYMAPEQLVGGVVDTRSDIYSLGVVLFEMATGRRPYAETNAAALAVAMSASPPPPPDAIDPRVPRRLSSVIVKALQREPFNRYQTADELGAALDELAEPTTRAVVDRVTRRDGLRPMWALLVLAATLAIIGAVVWRPLLTIAGLRRPPAITATVLAILPVDNPTGDPQASYLGEALASAVATNLRAISGFKVVSRASTVEFARRRADSQAIKNQLGADFVLDLTVKAVQPRPELNVRFRRASAAGIEWQETLSGDPVEIEGAIVDGVSRRLAAGARRTLTDAEWATVRRLPTARGGAMLAYIEARALLERNDIPANIERAIDRLQNAVETDASFALGHAALGVALLMRWEKVRDAALIDRATPEVTTALRLNPELSAAHYAFGMLLYITGKREAAAQSLKRAIELDPDADDPHRLLGWRILSPQGRIEEAVAEMREAVRIRPDSFENHYRLGNVFYLAGRYREAAEAFRAATEIQPRRADAFTNLGAAYSMLGDVEQALGNYQHAISLGAGDAVGYANLAYNYYLAGRYDQARAAELEAIKRAPTRASLQADLGEYEKRLGHTPAARAAYARAIELARRSLEGDPRDAGAVVLIAICEANLGRPAEAERRVAEALVLAPEDRNVLLSSTKVYTLLGNRSRAFDNLRGAIQYGLSPQLARQDPELSSIKPFQEFETAIAAGLRARARAGTSR